MLTPPIRAISSSQNECYTVTTVRRVSTLALFVPRVLAYNPHHTLAPDDLAVAADSFHRSQDFHDCFLSSRAEHDAPARQVVRRQLHGDLVAGQDADIVHAHLPGD